jgi:two-component system, cell cycle response regulator CpdR
MTLCDPESSPRVVSYLYVEDRDEIRELIESFIETDFRKVTAVAHAEAALSLMEVERYDVLMTDVGLPGMSGTDLARHWIAKNPSGWVILCTGYEFRLGLESIGKNVRTILKSFEPEELEALLSEVDASINRAAA